MIVFHEGLPGAGKSYEACVFHILPALQAGRRVITNIAGVNHEEFAKHSGLPIGAVKALLTVLDIKKDLEQQPDDWIAAIEDDALCIMDEVQNIFPCGRQRLSNEWQIMITEHRHRGLDFVLMGQDKTDIHKLWRARLQRIIYFTNLEAVGGGKRYKWEAWEKQGAKFIKMTSGVRSYEKKLFPLYSSFDPGATNSDVYADRRSVVLSKGRAVAFVGVLGLLLFGGISGLAGFFDPDDPGLAAQSSPVERAASERAASPPVAAPEPAVAVPAPPPVPVEPPPLDYFDAKVRSYRMRLGGLVQSPDGSRFLGFVQAMDGQNREVERFRFEEVEALGWTVSLETYGLSLRKEDTHHIVRPWGLDLYGRVSQSQRNAL